MHAFQDYGEIFGHAGIFGALFCRGKRVAVLEAWAVGSGMSGRSLGMLSQWNDGMTTRGHWADAHVFNNLSDASQHRLS